MSEVRAATKKLDKSGIQRGWENYDRIKALIDGQYSSTNKALLFKKDGTLNRKRIAELSGIHRSALAQNPHIKKFLAEFEAAHSAEFTPTQKVGPKISVREELGVNSLSARNSALKLRVEQLEKELSELKSIMYLGRGLAL